MILTKRRSQKSRSQRLQQRRRRQQWQQRRPRSRQTSLRARPRQRWLQQMLLRSETRKESDNEMSMDTKRSKSRARSNTGYRSVSDTSFYPRPELVRTILVACMMRAYFSKSWPSEKQLLVSAAPVPRPSVGHVSVSQHRKLYQLSADWNIELSVERALKVRNVG